MSDRRARFRGTIAGLGSRSGVRVVVGSWSESPYAAFADVMLAEADGTRRLLAPSDALPRRPAYAAGLGAALRPGALRHLGRLVARH